MNYHLNRLRADIRGLRSWIVLLALATLVTAVLCSLMAALAQESAREGTLSTHPPAKSLAFIRTVDPHEGVAQNVNAFSDTAVLDEPAVELLLDYVSTHDDSFIELPLNALTSNIDVFPRAAFSGRVIIGRPLSLNRGWRLDGASGLYGSLTKQPVGVTSTHIGTVGIRQRTVANLSFRFVDGNGYVTSTKDQPLVTLSRDDAEALGVFAPYHVSDVTQGFTCYCSASSLNDLAQSMTRADDATRTGRSFYVTGYAGLIGPSERSSSALALLNTTFAAGVISGLGVFTFMAAHLLWVRCRANYIVEWYAGASKGALFVRQTAIAVTTFSAPLAIGFWGVQLVLRGSSDPPALPASALYAALLAEVAFQGALALQTWNLACRDLCFD